MGGKHFGHSVVSEEVYNHPDTFKIPNVDSSESPLKTYVPFGCLVAVHLLPRGKTASGLVVPDTAREGYETTRCLVIAVGPECKQVKEGDVVLCVNNAVSIIHDGNKTALLREDAIAGVEIKKERSVSDE